MLSEADYDKAASLLLCEVKTIKAIDSVESGGMGFLSTGELRILFEPHIFYKLLKEAGLSPDAYATNKEYSDIIYPHWGQKPYGKYSAQWERLTRAATINRDAAYKSASYGKYQPLGLYHKEMGYDTVFDMVDDFKKGEPNQLMGFVKMIKYRGLADELRDKDWAAFARAYNGSGNVANYSEKLEAAYNKL